MYLLVMFGNGQKMAFPKNWILVLQPAFRLLPVYLYLQVQVITNMKVDVLKQHCYDAGMQVWLWVPFACVLRCSFFLGNDYLSQRCFVNQIDSAAINLLPPALTPSVPVCRIFYYWDQSCKMAAIVVTWKMLYFQSFSFWYIL